MIPTNMAKYPSTYRLPYVVLPCGHAVARTTADRTAHTCPGVKR